MSEESIKVAVRIRPLNNSEIAENASNIVIADSNNITIVDPVSKKEKEFAFDYVFNSDTTNKQIYESIGTNIVKCASDGYNCCVLAYGQTGSGKTYTMLNYSNNNDENGIIPQIANALIGMSDDKCEVRMEASFIEIYDEKIFDLLSAGNGKGLKLHINPKIGTYIENLTNVAVTNISEVMKIIDRGFRHRSTSATAMNEQSSRSHAIFTINFKKITYSGEGADRKPISTKSSKINLVDLAGSERVKTSKVTGINFQEAISINKSLSTLSTVFTDLVTTGVCNKFRNSVLTALLADSISGRSKTIIIANISPASIQYDISTQTLFYVNRTKKITIHAKVNEVKGVEDRSELKLEIDRLLVELENAKKLSKNDDVINALKAELAEYQSLYRESTVSWSDKLQESYNLIKTLETETKNHVADSEAKLQESLEREKMLKDSCDSAIKENEAKCNLLVRAAAADCALAIKENEAKCNLAIRALQDKFEESNEKLTISNMRLQKLEADLDENKAKLIEGHAKWVASSIKILALEEKLKFTVDTYENKMRDLQDKCKLVIAENEARYNMVVRDLQKKLDSHAEIIGESEKNSNSLLVKIQKFSNLIT